jgi:hypothetical protein
MAMDLDHGDRFRRQRNYFRLDRTRFQFDFSTLDKDC